MDLRIESPRRRIASDLRASTVDGCCYSGMVGLGETWFIALYLAIGFGATTVAWLATLPVLTGSLMQLATPTAIRLLGSWKRWVVFNAALQAVSLMVLALMVQAGVATAISIFLIASIYFGAGQATAPAWNLWIERLVPKSIRTSFLSRRQRASQVCLLGVVILAGLVLRLTEGSGTSPVIPLLFFLVLAGALRMFSAWCLGRQTEEQEWISGSEARNTAEATKNTNETSRIGSGLFYQLLMFLVLMQMAVYISSSFFTPFKIKALQLDYAQFSMLVIAGYVGKIMSLGLAGRLARRWGSFRLLLIGALGIVPMAGLWVLSQNFSFLIAIQFCSGFMWACYDLAMVMVFVEVIPRVSRLRMLSQYNLANSLAMVAGTGIGTLLFALCGEGYAAYLCIFACSSICRLLFIGVFPFRLLRPAESEPAGRLLLFSPSFELSGRGLFRNWQSVPDQDRQSKVSRRAA